MWLNCSMGTLIYVLIWHVLINLETLATQYAKLESYMLL